MKSYNGVMAEPIFANVHPELKKLIEEKAEEMGMFLNEYLARLLAEHVGRPDLNWIPRKRRGGNRKGRPRTKVTA